MKDHLSPVRAIRGHCIACCGHQLAEVRRCPIPDCPLFPYRMGVRPETWAKAESARRAHDFVRAGLEDQDNPAGPPTPPKNASTEAAFPKDDPSDEQSMEKDSEPSSGCLATDAARPTSLLGQMLPDALYHETAEQFSVPSPTIMQVERIFFHDERGGRKCAGVLYANGTFVKTMEPCHLLKSPPAIAIQAAVVEILQKKGCLVIRAEVAEGPTYLLAFHIFMREAFELCRGHGQQLAVHLVKWRCLDSEQPSLFEEAA